MSKRHPNTEATYILSPRWSAPELFKTRIPSFETDIWALGCTFVELLNNGQKPFCDMTTQDLEDHMRRGDHITPSLDSEDKCLPDMKSILDKMFQHDPNDRPTAREVYQHMEAFYKHA